MKTHCLLNFFLLLAFPCVLPAQDSLPKKLEDRKDPGTALAFSVFAPGAGQMYAGKPGKGAALLVASVGALVLGAATTTETCTGLTCTTNYTGLQLGVAASIALWGYSMVTAGADAREHNAKLEKRTASVVRHLYLNLSRQATHLGMTLPLSVLQ